MQIRCIRCVHTHVRVVPLAMRLLTLFSHITGLLCAHSLKSKLVTVFPGDSVSMVTHKESFPPGMQEEGQGRREGLGTGEVREGERGQGRKEGTRNGEVREGERDQGRQSTLPNGLLFVRLPLSCVF